MASRMIRVQALGLILTAMCCGCSVVGLGYRADHSRGTGRAEAARLSELAELYERQGHPAGAMRLYRQALHADPRSQTARQRLMALSTQPATPPQPQKGIAPTPASAASTPTMLAQTTAGQPSDAQGAAPRLLSAAAGSPALATEPSSTPLRPAATESQPPAGVQPATVTAARQPQSSSVVADSASAVAMAAAPILALIGPPTGESPLVAEHRAGQKTEPEEAPLPPAEAVAVAVTPIPVEAAAVPRIQPAPARLPVVETQSPAPLRALAPAPVPTEAAVSVAIATPPALPPQLQESPSMVGWTASGSGSTVEAPVRLPVTSSGIVIRPQSAAVEEPGRAQFTASKWGRTDHARLFADAPEELLVVVRRLESADATVRKDALIELAELGSEATPVAAAVRALFEDSDAGVRAHAAWAACRISGVSDECISVLAGVVECNDAAGATFAAYCLGLFEADAVTAVPALQNGCLSDVPAVRLCAAEALLKITPDAPEPVATLIQGLHEAAPEHRWLAALSLSAASADYQAPAIEALIPVLHDADADVCSSAALALGAFGSAATAAAPELEAVLSHPQSDVRDSAAAALECIRN